MDRFIFLTTRYPMHRIMLLVRLSIKISALFINLIQVRYFINQVLQVLI
jgi:hypothetical protein